MRLLIDIEQDGKHSKCTSGPSPENIKADMIEMATNPKKREQDCNKIAVRLVAIACGLHTNPTELFAQFNQVDKT
jgi:hypothetical protein